MEGPFTYRPDPEFTRSLKLAHAPERKRAADAWRTMRAKSPAITRLLFKRMRKAEREVVDHLWGQGTGTHAKGGLADLLKD